MAKVKKAGAAVIVFLILGLLSTLALSSSGLSADDSPLIHHASVQPTKVYPGDTITVTAEVSDSSGIESVTADMGGINTISLILTEGSVYHGTWQGQWLVHDTRARDYVTTIVATNFLGKSATRYIIWSDPQTYERYHKEYVTEQTTTDTNWVDALAITFTPNVDGNFYVHASATLMNDLTVITYTEVQVIYNLTVINTTQFTPVAATDKWTFGAHNVISLTGSTQYTFKIQFRTGDATSIARISDLRFSFFAVSDYHHTVGTDGSNNTTAYANAATLTFTPATAGDYFVIASMELAGSAANRSYLAQLLFDGTTSWGEMSREPVAANEYQMYLLFRKQNLTNVSHTFNIQYKCGTTPFTASIRRARITAIRLTDLGDAEYSESEAEESTTSTIYVLKGSLSWDHVTYENCFRLMLRLIGGSVAKYSYSAWFEEGVQAGERTIKSEASTDRVPLWGGKHRYYDNTAHTFEHKYKAESPATAYAKNVRLIVIRADTLAPFSNSGHTTYCNNFNSWSLNRAYVQGCFFEYRASPPKYHVAYYDGGDAGDGVNGALVLSDGANVIDANGKLTSECYFPFYPSAKPGLWHAVVYDDGVGSPPSNYIPNDPTSIRECSFTVTQAAIPEFPTVVSAIVVATICFGIFYWMRRRRLESCRLAG